MSARNLTESAAHLIISQIKNNITSTLASISSKRGDNLVNLPSPPTQSYFYYAPAINFRAPGIFVIPRGIDFRLGSGQNFVNSIGDFLVSAVVEERTPDLLEPLGWRYMDALHMLLQGIEVVDSAQGVKIIISVRRGRYSDHVMIGSETQKVFRKEIALDCDVEIYENL